MQLRFRRCNKMVSGWVWYFQECWDSLNCRSLRSGIKIRSRSVSRFLLFSNCNFVISTFFAIFRPRVHISRNIQHINNVSNVSNDLRKLEVRRVANIFVDSDDRCRSLASSTLASDEKREWSKTPDTKDQQSVAFGSAQQSKDCMCCAAYGAFGKQLVQFANFTCVFLLCSIQLLSLLHSRDMQIEGIVISALEHKSAYVCSRQR